MLYLMTYIMSFPIVLRNFFKPELHYKLYFSCKVLMLCMFVTHKMGDGGVIMTVADILKIKAVSAGVVVIKGEASGRYLAMSKKGHLYGSVSFK